MVSHEIMHSQIRLRAQRLNHEPYPMRCLHRRRLCVSTLHQISLKKAVLDHIVAPHTLNPTPEALSLDIHVLIPEP